MKKFRHHFVPRFYLKLFSQNTRQINLFNISREKVISGASIKHQCCRHKLYGGHDDLENAFMEFETKVAPVVKRIIGNREIPERHSEEWIALVYFIAFQHLRTVSAKNRHDDLIDLSAKAVLEEDPRVDREERKKMVIKSKSSFQKLLRTAPYFSFGISDLEARLVVTEERKGFFTSDNPVFIYNQYCETVKGLGVLGAVCSGLQVFLPLGPNTTLCMFDGKIYALDAGRHDIVIQAHRQDVEWLNLFQMVNAAENVYYFAEYSERDMKTILSKAGKHRGIIKGKVAKADGTHPEERSVLIHSHYSHPVIKPVFSFFRIRRRARKIPVLDRGSMYRETIQGIRENSMYERSGGKTTSWVVRRNK